jgi:hypothetical protein
VSRVFRKTALGVATFTKQETGLTQSQRGLLIMVDGKRSAAALRKFGSSFGNVNVLLRELFDAGLIELDAAYVEKIRIAQAEIAQESADLPSALVAETVVATTRPMPSALSPIAPVNAPAATNINAAKPAPAPAPARDIRHDLRNLGAPDPIGTFPSLSPMSSNTITRTPLGANTQTRSSLSASTITRTPLDGSTVIARSGPATVAPTLARPPARAPSGGLSLSLEPAGGNDDASVISSASESALADARKFATHFVFDALGNSGTALCFAIERTETLKGLIETTDIARNTLRNMKSEATAEDFSKQLREILTR